MQTDVGGTFAGVGMITEHPLVTITNLRLQGMNSLAYGDGPGINLFPPTPIHHYIND